MIDFKLLRRLANTDEEAKRILSAAECYVSHEGKQNEGVWSLLGALELANTPRDLVEELLIQRSAHEWSEHVESVIVSLDDVIERAKKTRAEWKKKRLCDTDFAGMLQIALLLAKAKECVATTGSDIQPDRLVELYLLKKRGAGHD